MATLYTPRYEIDTENFETAADVNEWVGNVEDEADAICENCKKGYYCQDLDRNPENYANCTHRDEYEELQAVIDALVAYGVELATKRAA